MNQGWAQSEFIKSNVNALPPECRDLLNQIFEVSSLGSLPACAARQSDTGQDAAGLPVWHI